jgi:hypothetical protein
MNDDSDSSYSYQGQLNESETYTSDDINIAAFNKNMGYNSKGLASGNNFNSTQKSAPGMSTNKYDVNNAGYRISGVTGFSNTTKVDAKYNIASSSKPSDPYGNIALGNLSMPKTDSYNINIDFKNIKSEVAKPVEQPKPQPKKKMDFFDNLESQLKKEDLQSESSSNPYDFSMDLKRGAADKSKEQLSESEYKLEDTEKMSAEENYYDHNDNNQNEKSSSRHDEEEKKPEKSDSTISYRIEAKEPSEKSEKSYDYDKYTGTMSKDYFYPGSGGGVRKNETEMPKVDESSKSYHKEDDSDVRPKSASKHEEYNDFQNETEDKYNDFQNDETENKYNDFEDTENNNISLDKFKSPKKDLLSSQSDLKMSDVLSSTDRKQLYNDFDGSIEIKKVEPIRLEDNYKPDRSGKPSSNNVVEVKKDNGVSSEKYGDLIKELITAEVNKMVASKVLNSQQPQNSEVPVIPNQDYTKINEAREELYKRKLLIQNADHFLINVEYKKRKPNKFDTQKLFHDNIDEFVIYPSKPKVKKDIAELKFENALAEERKRKDYLELLTAKQNEVIEELDSKIRKYKKVDIENEELKKLNMELQLKYKELDNEFANLKSEYEVKAKLVEDRVVMRESKSEARKLCELKRQYEIEIDNFKNEINEKLSDLSYYKKQCEYYEGENTKLLLNKLSNIESNEKVKEVQNENFIVHEKYNELLNKYEKLVVEKDKLEKKAMTVDRKEDGGVMDSVQFVNKIELNKPLQGSSGVIEPVNNIFEQLLIERETNIQENIIKSYDKEIEKLKNEIKLLKNINRVGSVNTGGNALKEKPVLKESAEEKIKQLSKILHEGGLMEQFENEFLINDVVREGEVDQDTFIRIIQNLKIRFDKYDIIEIFNNFNRSKDNKIRYMDLINALASTHPSSYFIQPDPTYLKELENKIISYEKKLKQYEIEAFIRENNDSEVEKKNYQLETDKEELKRKIAQLEDEKKSSQGLLSEVLKNNYLQGSGIHTMPTQKDNEAISKLKSKIKSLEEQNIQNLKDFEGKVKDYEAKFDNLGTMIKKPINDENKELKHKIEVVEKENIVLKQRIIEIELQFKNDKDRLFEKLKKYKRNYKELVEKYEKTEREKDKIIKSRHLTPSMISNILNIEEIENLNRKLEGLEKKNKEREEHYVKLCNNANVQQVNKEIENYSKKFEDERKQYYSIINQKNSELLIIKKEFEEIYKELEELRNNKRIR